MNNNPESKIDRRQFLRGSLGVVGASLLSLGPTSALAKALGGTPPSQVEVAFWNGERFVNLERVAGVSTASSAVRVTLRSFGKGSLSSIDTETAILSEEGEKRVPFHAWTALTGARAVRFVQPVDPADGLVLNVLVKVAGQKLPTPNRVTIKPGQLMEGTYALAPAGSSLGMFALDSKNKTAPLSRLMGTGPEIQCVLLTVEFV